MPRSKIRPEALTIGQLATRWGVSPERVRALIEDGKLQGAFQIPSAGRYGATIKIPIAAILDVERDWAVEPSAATRSAMRRSTNDARVVLKHFPHLNAEPLPDSESRGAALR
jgi:hypothetical protein